MLSHIEAQQGSKSQNRHNNRSHRKTLRFEHDDDDNMYEYNCISGDRARSVSQSKKQSLQKVNDKPTNSMPVS